MNLIKVECVKDWSLIDQYDTKITEAQSLIQMAEAQLAVKFVDVHRQMAELDKAILAMSQKRANTNDPIITVDVSIREIDNGQVHVITEQVYNAASEQSVKIEEEPLKKLFKRIAKFTHPDKLGDIRLFKEAKKALKEKNRARLLEILDLVTADYDELIRLKLTQYQSIIDSVQYLMAVDFFSHNQSLINKAESYYFIVLNQTIRNKIQLYNELLNRA